MTKVDDHDLWQLITALCNGCAGLYSDRCMACWANRSAEQLEEELREERYSLALKRLQLIRKLLTLAVTWGIHRPRLTPRHNSILWRSAEVPVDQDAVKTLIETMADGMYQAMLIDLENWEPSDEDKFMSLDEVRTRRETCLKAAEALREAFGSICRKILEKKELEQEEYLATCCISKFTPHAVSWECMYCGGCWFLNQASPANCPKRKK